MTEQALSSLDTTMIYVAGMSGNPDTIQVTNSSGTEINEVSTDIERIQLYGNNGNDTLDAAAFPGNGGAYLIGYNGDDMLIGSASSDSLYGYAGNDTLTGNEGSDYLVGYDE